MQIQKLQKQNWIKVVYSQKNKRTRSAAFLLLHHWNECVHSQAAEVLVVLYGTAASLHLPTALYASSVTAKMEATSLGYNEREMFK